MKYIYIREEKEREKKRGKKRIFGASQTPRPINDNRKEK
jgi:hypothetical protein